MSEEFFKVIKKSKEMDEVEDIDFDGIQIKELQPKMKQALETLTDLKSIQLNSCGLENLKNLPNLPELLRIELSNNKFKPSEIKNLLIYKKLECVQIGNNQINSIDDLKVLSTLDSIVQLDLDGTELSKKEDYRESVFKQFPNLMILDNKNAEGNSNVYDSEEDEDQENNWMKPGSDEEEESGDQENGMDSQDEEDYSESGEDEGEY